MTINFLLCEVADTNVAMPALEDLSYQIGDVAVEIPFDLFYSIDANSCNYSWTYSIVAASGPIGGADISAYATI